LAAVTGLLSKSLVNGWEQNSLGKNLVLVL
jgi:hypothetical protein